MLARARHATRQAVSLSHSVVDRVAQFKVLAMFQAPKVFISSTSEDLNEFREFANRQIRGLNLAPESMDNEWRADARSAADVIRERLRGCDLFLGILAWRYGEQVLLPESVRDIAARPKANRISYTELEYCWARAQNIPCLMFLTHPDSHWKVPHIDKDRRAVESFRKTVANSVTPNYFRDHDEFMVKIAPSVMLELQKSTAYQSRPPAERALREVANLVSQDIAVRDAALRQSESRLAGLPHDHQWFVREIGRCNFGNRYIDRRSASHQFAAWLHHHPTPFCLVVGSSGIGKTNFLLDEIRYFRADEDDSETRPVVFFPLGLYDPDVSVGENIRAYLTDRAPRCREFSELSAAEYEALAHNGRVLLILDGLDELLRQKGQASCERLIRDLRSDVESTGRVVISCRDHIYRRLRSSELFDVGFEVITLGELADTELDDAIDRRIDRRHWARSLLIDKNSALRGLARHPLLLELLAELPRSSSRRLRQDREQQPARVYELWFEEAAGISGLSEETDFLEVVQRIARTMLERRSDTLTTEELKALNLSLDKIRRDDDRLSVFVQQTSDEWGFVHDSFREYALAKTVESELHSRDYEFLAATASLDYVGSETFRFLYELLPTSPFLQDAVAAALGRRDALARTNRKHWNNLVQNCVEAIGMMADLEDAFEAQLLELLNQQAATLTNQTKYNIVRCLERLHSSAHRPYWKRVMELEWRRMPDEQCFGVAAVRGFQLSRPRVGYSTHMEFRDPMNASGPEQKPVSDVLVTLLEQYAGDRERNGGLIEVNSTCALIRWLHRDHVSRLYALEGRLCAESLGNVFHALRRLRDAEDILAGREAFFRGMALCFVGSELGRRCPQQFAIDNVIIYETDYWKWRVENPCFPDTDVRHVREHKPKYRHMDED